MLNLYKINKLKRVLKAQSGLRTSFPLQTYWDSNSGLIVFNDVNQQWQNNTTSSLLGNPFMKSTGIPTEGKPNISLDAQYAARSGMRELLYQLRKQISDTADAVAVAKNPQKSASLIATGSAEVVNGLVLKKSSLNQGLLNNIGNYIGLGADFLSSFIPRDYSGKYGSLLQGADLAFDSASSAVMQINPLVGGIMKAGGLVSDVLTEYAGMGTDNMTKTDAILGSKLLSLTPWGMANGFFGKKTQDFSADNYTLAQVGGSYGGSVHDINNAVDKANKKYGWFSSGSRRKANRQIDDARRLQNLMAGIADDAMDRAYMGANMSDLNHIKYGFDINGGYDLRYMRAAKLGGKLKRVKKINFHKAGGEIKGVIDLNWTPEIINPIETFEEGGNIEWKPEILLEGGNITNKLAILDLFKDYDLSNVNIIDSLSPRVEGNNIYAGSDEDLIHELHHYTSQNKPNELYKDFYSDLNDDKITNLGGNLKFVSRTGDPSDFYAPAELEARLKAAKYKSKGLNYTKDFFKLLRADENKYGYNMRDLLYMFNDENLERLFNLKYLNGGKTRTIDELIEYAKLKNPRFILRLSEPLRYIKLNYKNDKGEDEWSHATHEMTYRGNIVYPMIQEIEGKLKRFDSEDEAYDTAVKNNNILEFNSEDEAKLFSKSGKDEQGNFYGYKLGWKDFFNSDPTTVKAELELNLYKQGGKTEESSEPKKETTLKNIIPEGALHAHKHNMENAEDLTKKGIPVVDEDNQQQAEIEREEIIFTLEVTKKLEELYNDGSDEAAIEAGKLLVKEILFNTEDRTGLIAKCENGGVINGTE